MSDPSGVNKVEATHQAVEAVPDLPDIHIVIDPDQLGQVVLAEVGDDVELFEGRLVFGTQYLP